MNLNERTKIETINEWWWLFLSIGSLCFPLLIPTWFIIRHFDLKENG